MKPDEPSPGSGRAEAAFQRFKELTRRIIAVPKSEVVRKQKAAKRRKKGRSP